MTILQFPMDSHHSDLDNALPVEQTNREQTVIDLKQHVTEQQARHMIEARYLIEVEAARLAALHRTEEDLQHMQYAMEQMNTFHHVAEADIAFHESIIQATHNPLIQKMYEAVAEDIHALLIQIRAYVHTEIVDQMKLHYEHVALFEAISQQKENEAAHGMLVHLAHVEKNVTSLFESQATKKDAPGKDF